MEDMYGKYHFRPKIFLLLLGVLVLCIATPFLLLELVNWPSTFSSGTISAISYGTVIIGLGFWMILYRNTRPKTEEYFRRRNFIGIGLMLSIGIFLVLFLFINYYLIQNIDVVDLSWVEYFTDKVHTEYNLTLLQMWTDWGRFLGTVRYQIILALVYTAVAMRYSPKMKDTMTHNLAKKALVGSGITLGWIMLVELLILLGIGFIWPPVKGRLYLLTGFYSQHFNIVFIPLVLFMVMGNVVYLRGRQYFWADSPSKPSFNAAKGFVLLALCLFNLWLLLAELSWDYFFTDEGVVFMIFLFFNALLSGGTILAIQSKHAIMGGKPEKQIRQLSRLSWLTFFVGLIAFLLGFILQDIGMSFRPSEILAYYPNLLFTIVLTATTYYCGVFLQQKIDVGRQTLVE